MNRLSNLLAPPADTLSAASVARGFERLARLGASAVCAFALAACAIAPQGDETAEADSVATPAAKIARAGKANADKSRADAPPVSRTWGLSGLGDEDGSSPRSLDGLRADLGSFEQRGVASWYGKGFHGRKTANGERFDMGAMTAAHPSLPLDSWVLVRNLRNDKVAVLRINDRGPYHGNRVLDVSQRAAQHLGFKDRGSTQVEIRRLSRIEVASLGSLAGGDGASDGGGDESGLAASSLADSKAQGKNRKARKVKAVRTHKVK